MFSLSSVSCSKEIALEISWPVSGRNFLQRLLFELFSKINGFLSDTDNKFPMQQDRPRNSFGTANNSSDFSEGIVLEILSELLPRVLLIFPGIFLELSQEIHSAIGIPSKLFQKRFTDFRNSSRVLLSNSDFIPWALSEIFVEFLQRLLHGGFSLVCMEKLFWRTPERIFWKLFHGFLQWLHRIYSDISWGILIEISPGSTSEIFVFYSIQ